MNKNFFVLLGLVIAAILYFLAPILTPFLVGAILAYLADPVVTRLTRLGVPRLLSVILVFFCLFLLFVLFVLLMIPLIEKQILVFTQVLPRVVAWLQSTLIPWLQDYFDIQEIVNIDTLKATLAENWTKAGGAASWLWSSVLRSSFTVIAWITNLFLIPVVTFYFLRDWHELIAGVRNLIPRSVEPTIVKLAKESDSVLSQFFRGQLLVMLCLGIIYSVGLSLMGLQIGLMIGLLAGLMSIVPYLGFIVGVVAASIAAFVQFGTLTAVILVWVVFIVGQAVDSVLLTPNLIGERIGLHPVAVIFAILTGGSLFGFFGVLLALPVAAVLMVVMRYLTRRYRRSPLY